MLNGRIDSSSPSSFRTCCCPKQGGTLSGIAVKAAGLDAKPDRFCAALLHDFHNQPTAWCPHRQKRISRFASAEKSSKLP
jgi:aminoglycoside phosphotransferase